MYQGTALNFSDVPDRRVQTSPGPNVLASGGDVSALDDRVSALEGGVATRTVTGTVAVLSTDSLLLADATGGAVTVNLPAASASSGRLLYVKKIDSSGNTVTLDADGTDLIDGAGTKALTGQYDSVTVACNGAGWWIV